MLKILAIGNSFSTDSTEHLYNICKAGCADVKIGNLYIGGCSLQRHTQNIENKTKDYEYFINSLSQGSGFSVNEVIESDNWDIVTIQQASHFSGIEASYYPYINLICGYVKSKLPNSKIFINQTWAYEIDSTHSAFPDYNCDQQYMFDMLCKCYKKASLEIKAPVIPVGSVIQELRKTPEFDYKNGGRSLCRDGFHLDYIYGRYAAAATWYEYLIGGDITQNPFLPSVQDNTADADIIKTIKIFVHEIVAKAAKN